MAMGFHREDYFARGRAGILGLLLGCGVVVLLIAGVATAQPQVVASVESTRVAVNEPFIITVAVQGGRVGEPVIPHSDAIRFDRTPASSSSGTNIQFVNGQFSQVSRREWGFRAWATRPGVHKIPAIKVRIDGKDVLASEIEITATKEAPKPLGTVPSRPRGGQPASPQPDASSKQPTVEDAIFIESEVDKTRVYQGEPVSLVLKLIQLDVPSLSLDYTGGRRMPLPSTEGFYSGPVAERTTKEKRKGWDYRVREFRVPLFPTGTGEFTIGAWTWEGNVRWNSWRGPQRRYRLLNTDPIVMTVKPLPERPEDFSGAVGSFKVKASLTKGQVVQGVPTQLVVRIVGRGNPDAIGKPAVPEVAWGHVSPPETETEHTNEQDWAKIEKVFRYSITPLEAGQQTIPEIAFCYFAPIIGQYKTETTKPFSVLVKESDESSQLVSAGGIQNAQETRVQILSEDLEAIVHDPAPLKPYRPARLAGGGFALAPPALFAVFALFMRRRRRLSEDQAYARDYYARSRSLKRLQSVATAEEPSDELYRALTGFLADKLNVNEAGITSEDARRLLSERVGDTASTQQVVKVLRACERARYAGGQLEREEVLALSQAAEEALDSLDGALKKGARP